MRRLSTKEVPWNRDSSLRFELNCKVKRVEITNA